MSNTIRKPRKRPRIKSCNLRALFWAMRREGAFSIFYDTCHGWDTQDDRNWFAILDSDRADALAIRALQQYPQRRWQA